MVQQIVVTFIVLIVFRVGLKKPILVHYVNLDLILLKKQMEKINVSQMLKTNSKKQRMNLIHLCLVYQKANDHCYVCYSTKDEDKLLICESCKTECCHIFCLNPKLDKVPEEQWYCDFCVKNRALNQKLPIAGIFKDKQQSDDNSNIKQQTSQIIAPQNTPMIRPQQQNTSVHVRNMKTANLLNDFNRVNEDQQSEQQSS